MTRQGRRRRRRRRRRRLALRIRFSWTRALLVAGGLGCGLLCLAAIGPPPSVRIDELWVHEHLTGVRVLLAAAALAATASVAALLARRHALVVGMLWVAAVGLAALLFSDAVSIIIRVVAGRVR